VRVTFDKSIIAASIDAIVCADAEGKIILWNSAAETMFGYMEQEALGQPLTILLREEDRAAHLAGFQHFLKTGRPHRLIGKVTETFGLRKDGTVFSKEMSLAAEKVEGKWVFTAIMRDITERKRAEEQLSEQRKSLQTILDHAPVGVWRLGADKRIKFINSAFCNAVGVEERRFLEAEHYSKLLPDHVGRGCMASDNACFDTRAQASSIEEIPCVDGKIHSFEIIKAPILDDQGAMQGLVGLATDISERKQAEDDLLLKQKQLQSLLKISREINASLDQTTIRKVLVDAAISLMNATSGAVGLMRDGRMIFREYRPGDQWIAVDYAFEPGYGVPGHVMRTKKAYISNDAEHDAHVVPEIRQALGFHQLIDVPILSRAGELLGCLEIHDPVDARPFDDVDAKLLEGIAASAAVALDNANLIAKRKRMEKMMQAIAKVSAMGAGRELFENIARCLCELLEAECAIVGEITGKGHVQALAMQLDGNSIGKYAYDLSGTPCGNVVAKGYCEYPENVSGLFPDDKALVDMRAEGYAGTPVRGKEGNVIGTLCIIFRRTLDLPDNARGVFEIIATRVGAEIERMRIEAALRKRAREAEDTRQSMLFMLEDLNESKGHIERAKQEWEATFDAVTDPVFLHDRDGNIMRANNTYAGQAGMDMHDIIGKPYWQVFPVLDGPMHSCLRALETKEEEEEEEEDEIQMPDGRIFVSHSYAVRNKECGYAYSVHFMQDITERKQAAGRLRQTLEGTIRAIALAVEARDPYTAGHQARVAELACAIAQEMGLDAERVEGIRWGGMIHDIGKIHLPAEVLSKPSKLTEIEYALIKEHSRVGYDILKAIEFPWPVADITYQHHERLDGSGYPQGLKDDDICMEARIVAVADVTEAMASHRPYRPGRGIDAALAEIKRGRGKQYDPQAVDACITLFKENKFSFGKNRRLH